MADTDFSVSMCVYGGDNAIWFDRAMNSVLSQTVPPNELVLVVDGPVTDELNQIIEKYEQNPIVCVIRSEKNQGHGTARRTGLENCHNELIAIMDSDDVSFPDRFEKQLSVFAQDDSIDVVGGIITEFIGEEENVIGKRTVPTADADIKEYLKKRCPMNLVSVMFKKSSVERAGGFIDWYCEEDYYLWVRMYQAGMKFANSSDVLVNVRTGNDMYQRRGGIKYFKSELKLQNYMRRNKITNVKTYAVNVTERFIVQVLMPNKLRGWVFRKFAREN